MHTPARADPPYVPIRHTAWPTRKTPRWLLAAGVLVLAAGVLVGIAVHPSRSQRAADLNGFLADMNTDIQSCAGGVRDSLTAMRAIEAGTSHDVGTAAGTAKLNADLRILDNQRSYWTASCWPRSPQPAPQAVTLTLYGDPGSRNRVGL